MKFTKILLCLGAASMAVQPAYAEKKDKGPSRYLQCDGQPNNTTAGETAARLLGAITLLALFAPSPEAADPDARKFGEEGVAVCSTLLEGEEDIEGNPVRRLELLLARAVHHIEAKNYDAAIADVALAEREAQEKGFMDDPYFARSFARSFPQIKATALIRLGRYGEAQALIDQSFVQASYSVLPVLTTSQRTMFQRQPTESEALILDRKARIAPPLLAFKAKRLEELGQFAEASAARESAVMLNEIWNPEYADTDDFAQAAISFALAGNWEKATQYHDMATANLAERKAAGKNEDDQGKIIELLDLFEILSNYNKGEVQIARRNFAARSQWVAPSFGAVMATNQLLRADAEADDLWGGLEKTPEQLWQERMDKGLTEMVAKDADNKTLFYNIEGIYKASDFESLSKRVWRVEKSKIMQKEKINDGKEFGFDGYLLSLYEGSIDAKYDAYLLHSALLARHKGYKEFFFAPLLTGRGYGMVHFVEPENSERYSEFSLNAEEVISELSQIIPPPEEVKLRKQQRRKKKR